MAPRQRPPPPPPPPSAPGLLANVFNFVSREFESFVSTAAGTDPKVSARPLASSSRVTLEDNNYGDDKQAGEGKPRGKRVRRSADEPRRRRHSRVERGSEDEHPPRRRVARKSPQPPPSPPPPPSLRPKSHTPDEHSEPEEAARSPSPVPSPIPNYFASTPSVTMPGSLFPRSPSLQPDLQPIPQRTVDAARRVRFIPSSPTPPPREESEESEDERTPEATKGRRQGKARGDDDRGRDRDKKAGTTSVKDVAGQFARDSDYSLMFPSSRREKSAGRHPLVNERQGGSTAWSGVKVTEGGRGDGRGREVEKSTGKREGVGRRDREKGHERLVQRREESTDEDESYEEDALEYIPSRTAKQKGKERAMDTSGEIQVRGKERELRDARDAQSRSELDAQERIKMLEEEIAHLKAQLAAHGQHGSQPASYPLPPPPPPPPLRTSTSSMLSATNSNAPDGADVSARTSNFLLSIRAGLKHTDPPVEAPINPPLRTRRAGQPTVNVPTDKMAAFLSEMKTVRLRKVSGPASGSMLPPASTVSLARSMSNGATQQYAYGERSFNAVESQIGEKRKRDATGGDVPAFPAKRRYTNVTPLDTGSSFASSSSASASSDSRPPVPVPSSFSQSYPGPPGLPPRTWPSVASTETDLTTPSLCSDNENEHEHEQDSEEHVPHTPPTPHTERPASPPLRPARKLPAERHRAEPDMDIRELPRVTTPLSEPHPETSAPAKEAPPPRTDVFARRPPRSPMPAPTPRKPRPPARARPKPARVRSDVSDGDDPLSLSYSPPRVERPLGRAEPAPTKLPKPLKQAAKKAKRAARDASVSAQDPPRAPSNAARRRRTLDEELRRAGDELWSGDAEDDAFESGELVGVGSRSTKRGFLKGGGAAGAPVFMGVGYVQGVEADEDDSEEDIRLPWKGRKEKSRGG